MRIIFTCLLFLFIPFLGCLEDTATSPTPKQVILTPADQKQNEELARLSNDLSNLNSKYNQLQAKIDLIPQSQVSKNDIDNLSSKLSTVQSDISSLKTDVSNLKSNTSTNPYNQYNPYNPYPYQPQMPVNTQVTFVTNPTNPQVIGGYSVYTMTITNTLPIAQYIRPTIILTTTTPQMVSNFSISMAFGAYNMTGTSCWNINPDVTVGNITASNIFCTTKSACGSINTGEILVPASGSTVVSVTITMGMQYQTYQYYQYQGQNWTITHSLVNHP